MAEVKTQGAVEAMEVAEASRETEWEKPSFVGDLFLGKLNLDLIHPFPEQPAADKAEADEFLRSSSASSPRTSTPTRSTRRASTTTRSSRASRSSAPGA
jgi:hypothetical protein